MREYSVPSTVGIDVSENLSDAVFDNAARSGSAVAVRRKTAAGWTDVTAAQFADEVTAVAAGLIGAGIERGDRVALLSRTRYEWTLIDCAIAAAGAVTVPIYQTSSVEQINWILVDSGARAVVVESDRHREVVEELRPALPALRRVWQIEAGAVADIAAHAPSPVDAAPAVHRRRRGVRSSDLATLVYTSGTTGRPKGCELTHGNLLAEIKIASLVFPELLALDGSVLLFIPLAHVFGKVIQYAALHTGATIGHTPTRRTCAPTSPSSVRLSCPRCPACSRRCTTGSRRRPSARGGAGCSGAPRRPRWPGVARSTLAGRASPYGCGMRSTAGSSTPRILAGLGGQCVAAVSGGAPLGERLGHFFRGIGLPVYEGYGMTEASGRITINTPRAPGSVRSGGRARQLGAHRRRRRGACTRPGDLPRILERPGRDHRSAVRRLAAHRRPRRTGRDRVPADHRPEEGDHRHGRRQERRARGARGPAARPPSDQPVHSRRRGATVRRRADHARRGNGGRLAATPGENLRPRPAGRRGFSQEIDAAVAAANEAVSRAEAIRRYRILPVDFTEESGELTPTMKLRRGVIEKAYATDILAIYS